MVSENSSFSSSNHPLEQFVLLAKDVKGVALQDLIRQVLEAAGVYVFGELLVLPHVQELEAVPEGNASFNTLKVFAYGTYREYLAKKATLLELTACQRKKLQHLTIVTLATKSKCIPYKLLLYELDLVNVRDLEDLIIEAIYADVIRGKLDQKNAQLEIDYAIGRDTHTEDVNVIVNCLTEWCSACENVLGCVEAEIHRANSQKNRAIQRRTDIEQEIGNIRKTLKAQLQDRSDDADDAFTTIGADGGTKDPCTSSAGGSGTSMDKSSAKKANKFKGMKLLR